MCSFGHRDVDGLDANVVNGPRWDRCGKGYDTMKVGDLVEARHGEHGIVTEVEMMYPGHPQSPVGRIAVFWTGPAPRWWRKGLLFSTSAINRVVSRAK